MISIEQIVQSLNVKKNVKKLKRISWDDAFLMIVIASVIRELVDFIGFHAGVISSQPYTSIVLFIVVSVGLVEFYWWFAAKLGGKAKKGGKHGLLFLIGSVTSVIWMVLHALFFAFVAIGIEVSLLLGIIIILVYTVVYAFYIFTYIREVQKLSIFRALVVTLLPIIVLMVLQAMAMFGSLLRGS